MEQHWLAEAVYCEIGALSAIRWNGPDYTLERVYVTV